ncbi:MAG TPA: cyclase family protein [Chthoniobacterales bacterium]|nr:cyclase family protein [Chthoniobacterales bacterium]
MNIWDISRTLANDLAPWPGDTPFHFDLAARLGENAVVNVGAVTMGVHNGTHADARFHFEDDGWTIDQAPLESYFGPAVVVDLTAKLASGPTDLITIAHLQESSEQLGETSRLLLKTGVWPDNTVFPSKIPVLAYDVPEWLKDRGVTLLGMDLPSVDPIDAKVLANHQALAHWEIAIVESLDLSEIEPGVYNLAAFPLKIAGGDAAPVRAILWRD